jgi:hypothetical protein
MNEVDELVTAMLAIAFAAVMLVELGDYTSIGRCSLRPFQPRKWRRRHKSPIENPVTSAAVTQTMTAIDRFGKRFATAALH